MVTNTANSTAIIPITSRCSPKAQIALHFSHGSTGNSREATTRACREHLAEDQCMLPISAARRASEAFAIQVKGGS